MKLNTTHRAAIFARCPLGCDDVYDAVFHVGYRLVMVEDIAAAIKT